MLLKLTIVICANVLSVLAQTKTLSLTESFEGKPAPVFSRGKLLARDPHNSSIYIVASDGAAKKFDIRPKSDTSVYIYDFAVGPDESIVAVGTIRMASGTGSAIVLVNADGSGSRVVLTESFGLARVAISENRRIIVAGREFDQSFETVPDSNVLRLYSPDGVLMKKALSRKQLGLSPSQLLSEIKLIHEQGKTLVLSPSSGTFAVVDSDLNVLAVEKLPLRFVSGKQSNCAFSGKILYCSIPTDLQDKGTIAKGAEILAYRLADKAVFNLSDTLSHADTEAPQLVGMDQSSLVLRYGSLGSLKWVTPPSLEALTRMQ